MLENETPRRDGRFAEGGYEEQASGSYEEYGDSETSGYGPNEYEDENEENENIAEVAERILGARHSRVTTAAPIVTRPEAKTPAGERPKKTSAMTKHIPIRPRNEDLTRTRQLQAAERVRRREEEERRKAEAARKRKRAVSIAVFLVLVLIIGAGIGTAAAVAKHRAEMAQTKDSAGPADDGRTSGAAVPNGSDDSLDPGAAAAPDETDTPENPAGSAEPDDPDPNGAAADPAQNEPPAGEGEENPNAGGSVPDTGTGTDAPQTDPNAGGDTAQTDPTPGEGSEGEGTVWMPPELPKYWIVVDFYDRQDLTVYTEATTLGTILADNGITLDANERASVDLWNTWLAQDQTITVDKYVYITEDVPQTVAHTTEETGVDTIPRGDTKVLQEGVDGQSVLHYTVAYKNGVEFDRRLDWEEVVTAMVPERVQVGVGGTLVGKDGVTYSYAYHFTCPATYYNTNEYTFSGNYVSTRTVAADFNYFALGTRMYVKNNRYDFGYRVVEETGSNFDPWEIALWMPADDPNAALMTAEGYVYDMEVYILD